MPKDIQGKVVMITGGATGMGKATAKEFGALGAKVIVTTGHSVEKGEAVAKEIRNAGGDAIFLPCDISNEETSFSLTAPPVWALSLGFRRSTI